LYSPVNLFLIFYALVIFLTVLYHNFIPFYLKENLYNFDKITEVKYETTINVFVSMVLIFIVGAYTFILLKTKKPSQSSSISFKINTEKLINNSNLIALIAIVFLIIALFLVFLDYGLELFIRLKYLPNKTSTFKTIYQVLFIFISFLSGLLFVKKKFISLITIFITLLIGIALGTRFASVYLILYGVTLFVFITSRIRKIFFLLWFGVFVFLFFGFNIALRSETNIHGLIPYLSLIFEKPNILYLYALKNVYYSFVFGFYATADTIKEYTFYSYDKLWTCLNPLPGRLTNWYTIADRLRSNIFAPYTAIGELAKFKLIFIFYYFSIGYYFAYVENYIKNSFQEKKYLFPIMHLLILSLFIIFSFEYNLRSANRYIYYSLFLFVVVYVMKKLSRKKIVYHGK
jgi:hypothetical protein